MTDRERCENCDRPKATDEEYRTIAGGDGEHLCWNAWGCDCEPEDWRKRALDAELLLKRVAVYIGTGPKVPHGDCNKSCSACYFDGIVAMLMDSVETP